MYMYGKNRSAEERFHDYVTARRRDEPLDVRPLFNYMAEHATMNARDCLRAAAEQGKAFRRYRRDKIYECDEAVSTSARGLRTRFFSSTRSSPPTKAEDG
jgi:hypothetical protein